MSEQGLITLFERCNIELGNLDTRVVKAWFDTDCKDLLKWICSAITSECCYISPQEELEFSQIYPLTPNLLSLKTQAIEHDYPGILSINENLLDVELAKNTIDILEEQLNNCEHEKALNEKVSKCLLVELSDFDSKDIAALVNVENVQARCLNLSQELDIINKKTFEILQTYSLYLYNFETMEIPNFANTIDLADIEKHFLETVNTVNIIISEDDMLEISTSKYLTELLPSMENRIFHSILTKIALEMDVEALNGAINFLHQYDSNIILPFVEQDSLAISVKLHKEQQLNIFQGIEEASRKLTQEAVSEPVFHCLTNDLNYFSFKSANLNKISYLLINLLSHLVILYQLLSQEKLDIGESTFFFKNIKALVVKNIQQSQCRQSQCRQIISQFNNEKNCFFMNYSNLIFPKRLSSLCEVVNEITLVKNLENQLKQQVTSLFIKKNDSLKKMQNNIKTLQDFLLSEANNSLITVPSCLQQLFFKTQEILLHQNLSVKLITQIVHQRRKENSANSDFSDILTQLWSCFMTDASKFMLLFNQLNN